MISTKHKRREKTRQAILEGAYHLMIRQGYAATSMREIARQSQVALGGIYNHFPSKEAVFRAIVQEKHPFLQVLQTIETIEAESAEEFVRATARALVQQLRRRPDFLNLMLIEIVEFKARHVPLILIRFLPRIRRLMRRLTPFQGEVRNITGSTLVRSFLGMFFSYYITEMLMSHRTPRPMRRGSIDDFVAIFLRGILEAER